ncbi:aspartyl-phosphate phosphatase Spo0E family protein [Neobacillus sp. DY30]|uniref:aspartyl-phosphate phosphatase Spo0E family protein n=1 Tax=Neobacillus sp. DY30 TaxID=3047871 RepID=UPI0024BF369A|nr:aspartyl-phosphate phosphatase Spo0E family protein [Neobacillus sp. DY30]WHX98684.1 aspartyl-phosphate phosphatase Spo0E family protein [Neobacillus sp. DY30]
MNKKTDDFTPSKIVMEINSLRIYLVNIGKTKGLTHPDTIKISQELDLLINKYQHSKVL